MLQLSIFMLTVHLATVDHLIVLELEVVTIDDFFALIIHHFQQGGLIFWVSFGNKFAEGQEVFAIDTMIARVRQGERADVEGSLRGKDATTESGLLLIKWNQVDARVSILPETTKSAFHVAA